MVNFSLEGKVALVTGAAYGIGFAMAQALAEAGAKIAFNCRSQANMDKAIEDYKAIGIDAKGYICAKAVLPGMMERKAGKIINVCSMMSELGRETVSAYAAAKGGLKMLTKNIASEYGAYNIQCNGIGPGYIATPQTAPLRERQPDGSRHPFDSFIVAKTPAERWGNPEDLMGPVVFLASNASDFVNGHVLYVDGGILAYIGKQPK